MSRERRQGSRSTLDGGQLVSGRYRIESMLGRGGSATVYCAVDEQTGARLALKHLLADAGSAQHALFQREYYTLAQITHPGVIRVFDYGLTPDGPFYTMELLDGHDLSELSPLPWTDACRVIREVASALAILHSRRLIHRDVSHRNVRVTSDGRARLIDFGAMAPMGFVPELIGTPPFLSPEAVDGELLDQRADLYALGALLYWLLTGRHLYPAKSVRELRALWADSPAPVPEFPEPMPVALQQITMALLHRDARVRPSSAAEVIDRLTAIAGLPPIDDESIARAYLQNPKLIGREPELQALKLELERASAELRGTTLVIRGSVGTGKSRLLQEVVLQAKFAGYVALQASAYDSGQEPYALIARVCAELVHKLPHAAAALSRERAAVLAWAMPALHAAADMAAIERPSQPQELRARVRDELTAFLGEVAAGQRLLLAIDDVHAADDESVAVLLALAQMRGARPALVATFRHEVGRDASARFLLERADEQVELRPLTALETERLVESLFGSSPATPRVVGWMLEHARGNPLECMELARYLVDRRLAYYMGGAFMLPHELPAGVPRSLADAFRARIEVLPAESRAVAELLALYGRPAPLALLVALSEAPSQAQLFFALNQLISAELLIARGDQYALSREGLRAALLETLSAERRAELHQRIGDALIARGLPDAAAMLEAGHHLMRGHERLRGVELTERAVMPVAQGALAAIGEAVVPALELALELAEAAPLERARCMRLRSRLVICAYLFDKRLAAYAPPLLEQLRADSGLESWPTLPPGTGAERLTRAIELAEAQYARTPVEQRGLPPIEALVTLAMVVGSVLGVAIFGYDVELIARLRSLIAPFGELDKTMPLAMIHDLVVVIDGLVRGEVKRAQAERSALIARLRDPRFYRGLGDEHRHGVLATQLHASGMREAALHTGRAFAIADAIDALGMKMYAGAAEQIRLLAHLYRGDVGSARVCQLRLDAVSLQGGAGKQTEIWLLGYLVGPYSLWGDVIALKRTAERLSALVPDHPNYRPQLYIALGAYYRERGQFAASKSALVHAMELAQGRVQWGHAAAQYVETLTAAGEHGAALAFAEQHFGSAAGDERDPELFRQQLLPVLALARAREGAVEHAARELDAGIAAAEADGRPLAFVAKLYDARARVALLARDRHAFGRHAEHAANLYREVHNSALLLKHVALLDEAARLGLAKRSPYAPLHDAAGAVVPTFAEQMSATAPGQAHGGDRAERHTRALELILADVDLRSGLLFVAGVDGLQLVAASEGESASEGLAEAARALCAEPGEPGAHGTATAVWTDPTGQRYWLCRLPAASARSAGTIGVAALRLAPDAAAPPHDPMLLGAVARALEEAAELSTAERFAPLMAV